MSEYTEYAKGHLTGQPTAEDAAPKAPVPFEDPAGFTSAPNVSSAEVAHFKTRGFIVKRGLVRDDAAFAQVADHLWQHVPHGRLRRDDPATWLDNPGWSGADIERVGRLIHSNWKMRSPGRAGIGTEPFLVDRIANHPNMLSVARAFLGGPIKPARRVRGIYAVFPKSPDAAGRLGPHADYMAAELSAMVLVGEVPPRCGGFTLWPGSHHRLHPHWDTVHGGKMSTSKGDGFRLARDDVLRDITPVEITGAAGDVVFWHPRVLHSAGVNYSADGDTPRVRLIVPCDYLRAGLTLIDDDEYGPGEKYQWWVDTRNYKEDVPTTPDNIMHGWAI